MDAQPSSNGNTSSRLVPIAPAAVAPSTKAGDGENVMPYTCLLCARRKVRTPPLCLAA